MLRRINGLSGLILLITILVCGCGSEKSGGSATNPGSNREAAVDAKGMTDVRFRAAYEKRIAEKRLRTARIPMRSDGPKSLDPVRGSTQYENQCASQVLETLFQYKYLKRPFELEPLLLAEMPTVSDDGLTWHFKLKAGVNFHDDPCFADGKGREIKTQDVFYSWKRMADIDSGSKVWWLFKGMIAGFDEFRDAQNAAAAFDYDAPVPGLKEINDQEFDIVLTQPNENFRWKLAMFQTAIVAREAVEKYATKFGLRPVGTGPYVIKEGDWVHDVGIRFTRNPNYHESYFPTEHMEEDVAAGLTGGEGHRLPILDEVQVVFFKEDQPMWLQFKSDRLDYTQVPAENFRQAFSKRTKKLKSEFLDQGMTGHGVPLLDFIFRAFNMEDPVLGGYSAKNKMVRQAICLALDWDEQNDAFYNGMNVIYDGVIPPQLPGHPEKGKSDLAYRGQDLQRAKELLTRAGYPNGEGLPTLDYYTSKQSNSKEQSEMISKQLKEIGIQIKTNLLDFSQLIQKVDNKSAQFFSFAWGSDYPDGENNLALFYSPNVSPGSNHYNYNRPEYDALYEQIVAMPSGEERLAIYKQMQAMLMEDCPYAGAMARTRFYVVTSRVKYFKPVETFSNWFKYLDVER